MGRLLDIARTVPVVDTGPEERTIKQLRQLDHTAYRTGAGRSCAESEESAVSPVAARGGEFSQPAADVLDVLVKAGAPLPHTALVAALAARGHGRAAAGRAIADCQGWGWIEHNLITGYVISGYEVPGRAEEDSL